VQVQGWVRTRRDSKDFSFIELNDGSCLRNLQVIARNTLPNYPAVAARDHRRFNPVAWRARRVAGQRAKLGSGRRGRRNHWRVGRHLPVAKERAHPEFLREIAHLRPRSNLFGCVFRVRSRLAFAIHQFFQERGFVYVHTPIITGSDCEGAGELFRVTTLDAKNPPRLPDGEVDRGKDFLRAPDIPDGQRTT